MGRENFLRDQKPKRYPRRFAPSHEPEPSLARRVPVRPGRFPVGLDDEQRPLYPPPHKVTGVPVSTAAYLGRVEEIDREGEVTVRVWERPSGWEGMTTIDPREADFESAPAVGDLLWIWTWIDASKERGEEPRTYVQVEHRDVTDEERERLRALLARLEEGEK